MPGYFSARRPRRAAQHDDVARAFQPVTHEVRLHPADDVVIRADSRDHLVTVGHDVDVDDGNACRDRLLHGADRTGPADGGQDDRVHLAGDEVLHLRDLLIQVLISAGFEQRHLGTQVLRLVDVPVGLADIVRIRQVRNGDAYPIRPGRPGGPRVVRHSRRAGGGLIRRRRGGWRDVL